MSEYSRSSATFKNYAISLGIIVGIVLIMAFVVSTRSGESIPSVEYRPDADVLRDAADYPVTVPSADLEQEGWTPTSSTVDVSGPVQWSVGFATAEDSHAMVTQSDAEPGAVLAERVPGAERAGTVQVDGREWEHHASQDENALVLREEGVTLVVFGPADMDELTRLAEGLETDADGGEGSADGA
ncbi:DUF4245 domain-containing protein [Nocardiopsis dassonvillei]|uniref:DUF4245 domain-containing protein n=1 Tax=Nocardiopsis dassonvillei TaxID=2014 RepID=UPI000B9D5A75|nr:DUF4245 domain-containing protein [Nocardiopsis dassonvillei]ASU56792.1 hypothetical protein CGQ36_04220 [Nocardiopsis dassonvillei]